MHTEISGVLGFGDVALVKRHLVSHSWTSGRKERKQISDHVKENFVSRYLSSKAVGCLPVVTRHTPSSFSSLLCVDKQMTCVL